MYDTIKFLSYDVASESALHNGMQCIGNDNPSVD